MADVFDRVVVNPTLEQVEVLLIQAAATANAGQRARTVSASGLVREVREKWETNQSFADWVDGGGVPNSYRGFASTTVIGVAFVDIGAARHVRVYAARWEAPKSSYGRGRTSAFGLPSRLYERASVEALVYPVLQVALATRKKDEGVAAEMLRAVEAEPLDPVTWSALADYLQDNGHFQGSEPVTARRALEALACVRAALEASPA